MSTNPYTGPSMPMHEREINHELDCCSLWTGKAADCCCCHGLGTERH